MTRDDKGRFKKGVSGNPRGRLPRATEQEYLNVMAGEISLDDWRAICNKAKEQAKRGDSVARKWIADYLIGTPAQRVEHTGKDGQELVINWRMIEGGQDDGV